MKKLHEIYKLHLDDTRYRHKLKLRLKETFSEKVMFFQPNNRCLKPALSLLLQHFELTYFRTAMQSRINIGL